MQNTEATGSAGLSQDVIVPIIVVLATALFATFFFLVFRKTNRNISDMDNMFK